MDLFSKHEPPQDSTPKPKIYSVNEITKKIKILLEDSFSSITVRGEISNLTKHSSGHVYFTLKDEMAQIKCVIWRSTVQSILADIREGVKVLVRGKISLYEKGGYYQITVAQIQPEGFGELQLALERLKRKLFAEGLFDPAHKQPLPPYPASVGIITSPTGAAIRDIVSVAQRRQPGISLVLAPVRVQGDGAAEEIVQAIRDFAEYQRADVIILGRGGGSIEDLWEFNEEIVARAIYDSPIPIVSAVGHEIDFTIADLVADVRAATPSAAAELVVPSAEEMSQYLLNVRYTLIQHVRQRIELGRHAVKQLQHRYAFKQPESVIAQYRQQTDDYDRRLTSTLAHHFELQKQHAEHLRKRLDILNPRNTLMRGYTLTLQNGHVVSSARLMQDDKPAIIRFYDGETDVTVHVTSDREKPEPEK